MTQQTKLDFVTTDAFQSRDAEQGHLHTQGLRTREIYKIASSSRQNFLFHTFFQRFVEFFLTFTDDSMAQSLSMD